MSTALCFSMPLQAGQPNNMPTHLPEVQSAAHKHAAERGDTRNECTCQNASPIEGGGEGQGLSARCVVMIGVITWTLELFPVYVYVQSAGVGWMWPICCDVRGGDDGLDSSIHWASGGHPPTVAQIGEGDCREMISIDGTVWPKQGGRCAASPKTAHATEGERSTGRLHRRGEATH